MSQKQKLLLLKTILLTQLIILNVYGADIDDLTWITENNEIHITDCKSNAEGSLEIPEIIENLPVTTLATSCFYGCHELTEINLPSTIHSISNHAFDFCRGLKEIFVSSNNMHFKSDNGILYTFDLENIIRYPSAKVGSSFNIPQSVKHIADYTFGQCDNLNEITIPSTVKHIGESAFIGCGITKISLPDQITELKFATFYCCDKLEEIELPSELQTIDFWAMALCSNLKKITIPSLVTHIDSDAFYICEKLEEIRFSGPAPNDSEDNIYFIDSPENSKVLAWPEHIESFGVVGEEWNNLIIGIRKEENPAKIESILKTENLLTISISGIPNTTYICKVSGQMSGFNITTTAPETIITNEQGEALFTIPASEDSLFALVEAER